MVENLLLTDEDFTLIEELNDYLIILEDYLYFDDKGEIVDTLAIIEKYKYGAVQNQEEKQSMEIDESWRKMIPSLLKSDIRDWKEAPIESIYERSKTQMEQSTGQKRQEILTFVVELSQIIFESKEEYEEEIPENNDLKDEISDYIMNLVEIIIHPHLEVMDLIQQRGGKITFSNLWHKPFTDKLKEEVLSRDEWRCVICETETNLHVHHKIPRAKGGLHHKDNLVTLCASCHAAIEKTADIQLAFKKCLANYKKKIQLYQT